VPAWPRRSLKARWCWICWRVAQDSVAGLAGGDDEGAHGLGVGGVKRRRGDRASAVNGQAHRVLVVAQARGERGSRAAETLLSRAAQVITRATARPRSQGVGGSQRGCRIAAASGGREVGGQREHAVGVGLDDPEGEHAGGLAAAGGRAASCPKGHPARRGLAALTGVGGGPNRASRWPGATP
jgi:hypothetical protein